MPALVRALRPLQWAKNAVLLAALVFGQRLLEAGAVAVGVAISPWLLVCTMLLALFVGFAKGRHELATLADAAAHRANLGD